MRAWWNTVGRRALGALLVLGLVGLSPILDPTAPKAGASTYSDLILGDNPIGYFQLDEPSGTTAADSSPTGATGETSGTVTPGRPGVFGTSFAIGSPPFTGGELFIRPPSSNPNVFFPETITVEMWVRTRSQSGTLMQTDADGYRIDLSFGKVVGEVDGNLSLMSSFSIADGRWHHIALVAGAGGGGSAKLYIDGALDASAARADNPIQYFISCATFGNLFSETIGGLDEVALYDHALTAAQIHARWAAHSPYSFRTPDMFGYRDSNPLVADPVNTTTGSLTDGELDLPSPDGVYGLGWSRVYNSADTQVGPLGAGWTTAFSQTATLLPSGDVEVVMVDGRRARFTPDGSGGFNRPAELPAALVDLGGGAYRVDWFDGTHWSFDTDGLLSATTDTTGQTVTITRDSERNPATVASSTGASLTFTYTTGLYSGERLAQVATSDGRTVAYDYTTDDGQGSLNSVTDPNGKTTHYTVDPTGLITQTADATGRTTATSTYDDQGRIETQTSPSGGVTTFSYDDFAQTSTVHDSVTNTQLTYGHDTQGRVTSITDPANAVATRAYDASGNLTAAVDRLGASLAQTFDTHGNVLTSNQPGVGTTTYTYDGSDRVLTTTTPFGATTTYTYTGSDRVPTTITDGLGHTTTQTVTSGLVTQVVDPDGVTTHFAYDGNHRLTSSTDGVGHTTTYEYDTAGRRTKVTTPLGYQTITAYDPAGRVTSTTAPDGGVTSYTYDDSGRVLTTTDPTSAVTTNTYDTAGRLATTTKPGGAVTSYAYDNLGQLTVTTEPGGGTTTNTYGPLGRLLSTTDQLGRTTAYGYDANGNQTTVTAPDGGVTTTTYDTFGRVTGVKDPLNRTTTTGYDAFGRVTSTTTPGGHSTATTYDALGRTATTTNPRGGITTTTYTPGGRVASTTDPDGLVTTNAYDSAGRLSTMTAPGGLVTTYGYDLDGRQVTVTSPGGLVTATSYDGAGRVLTSTDPAGVITTNTWSLRGELLTKHVTGAGTVTYVYNPAGTLATVTDADAHTTSFGYDGRNNRTTRTNALGGVDQWAYDAANQLTSTTDPLNRTTSYTYDPAGRQATVTDPTGRVTTNTYDLAGQLTGRAYAGGDTLSFTYDADGNRTAATDPTGTTTYTYGPDRRLESMTGPDHHHTDWTYDPAGRTVAITHPDGSRYAYGYDASGRLATITALDTLADGFDLGPDGSDPDTKKWTKSVGAGGTATLSGGAAQLAVTNTTGSQATLISKAPDLADQDLVFSYQFSSNAVTGVLTALVRNGTSNNYRVEIHSDSATATIFRKVGSANTALATFTVPITTTPRWVRFEAQGTNLRARTWADGAPEPSAWDAQATDSAITAAGDTRIKYARTTGSSTASISTARQTDLASSLVVADTYTYDNDGHMTGETLPGGSRTWGYTSGRLTSLAQNVPNEVFTTNLAYDAAGRVATETTGTASTTYGYDSASQLVTITPSSGAATTYTYDALGRRTKAKIGAATTNTTYDAASQIAASGTTTYTYDAAGRRLSATSPTLTLSYAYDAAGRLQTLTRAATSTTTQTRRYNPDSQLVGVTNITGVTTTASTLDWDPTGGIPTLVDIAAGPKATDLVGVSDGWADMRQGPIITPLPVDVRGSVQSTTATSALARAASYDVWGVPTGSNTDEPQLGYRGQLHLDTVVYLRARDYNPNTGEFTGRDPIDGMNGTAVVANAYQYANNNPLTNGDRQGLQTTDTSLKCPEGQHVTSTPPSSYEALSGQAKGRNECVFPNPGICLTPFGGCDSFLKQLTGGKACAAQWDEECVSLGESLLRYFVEAIGTRILPVLLRIQGPFHRAPDYVVAEGTFFTQWFFGGGFLVTYSRSGSVFFAPEGGVGTPGESLTGRAGWLVRDDIPTGAKVNDFISGWSLSGSAQSSTGDWALAATWNASDLSHPSWEQGFTVFGNPGVSGSVAFSFKVHQSALSWTY